MRDRREEISQRALAIMVAFVTDNSIKRAARRAPLLNLDLQAAQLPSMVLHAGDEEADESDPKHRGPLAGRRVDFNFAIAITVGGKAEDLDAAANTLRRRLITAILGDATLVAITLNGKELYYVGTDPDADLGEQSYLTLLVRFSVTYPLIPAELAAAP